MGKTKDICPKCRFPKRISGHIFITKNIDKWDSLDRHKCSICKHFPDYIITDVFLKRARIIYRNFTGAKEYFIEVKKYLEENGFEITKYDSPKA